MLQQNITQAWVLTPGFGGRGKGKDVKRCEVIQTVKKVMTFSFVCVRCCDPVLNTVLGASACRLLATGHRR